MTPDFFIDGLVLTPELSAQLARDGISHPTEVQQKAAPAVLTQRDVIIQSGTGTGKTLAYLLPLLQRIKTDPKQTLVVLAPNPELAIQILRCAEAYKGPGIGSVGLVGGGNPERQKDKLKKHPQVMVGTPGRVLELMFMRKVKVANIGALVLDEIDEILSPHNEIPLSEICGRPEFAAQIICASATFGARAQAFVDRFMGPERLMVACAGGPLRETITHYAVGFEQQRKEVALLHLLESRKIRRALIFVNKLYNVSHLYRFLTEHDVPAEGLSAERDKGARERAIRSLKQGKTRLLIATDAAARGLDVREMDCVIHYEVARNADTYLHRAGRTGRAGRNGSSWVFVAPHERHLLKRYAAQLDIRFERA
jgi:ATP-dependent RNA helicase DeaD